MAEAQIKVMGMTCGGCERSLAESLTGLDGVRQARADRTAEHVTVEYDPAQIDEPRLRTQIVQAGYQVA